jgi:hypothetical protein
LSSPDQYARLDDALTVIFKQVSDVFKKKIFSSRNLFRRDLAASAFQHTAHYDHLISSHLFAVSSSSAAPKVVFRRLEKVSDLKYGCNPHQKPAALYVSGEKSGFKLLNGRFCVFFFHFLFKKLFQLGIHQFVGRCKCVEFGRRNQLFDWASCSGIVQGFQENLYFWLCFIFGSTLNRLACRWLVLSTNLS